MEHTDETRAALEFLKSHSLGAIATTGLDGSPRVRVMYYACDDDFSIYIFSLRNTRKVEDIHENARAAFTVASDDTHHTLQIEGQFEGMTDTATFGPALATLTSHLFPADDISAPVTHLDLAKPVMFKLVPTWLRWGDFTKGSKTDDVFTEIKL